MLPEASRLKAGQIGLAFPWHLPDLFTKEYQLLYKREYLENQPLTKALNSKSISLVYSQTSL
jgi:hypothetical protein